MPNRRIKRVTKVMEIVVATDDDQITTTVGLNGILRGIEIDAPDLDDTDTYTFSITRTNGASIYSEATIAENVVHEVYADANDHPLALPVEGTYTLTILTSGAQAADREFSVDLLVERF